MRPDGKSQGGRDAAGVWVPKAQVAAPDAQHGTSNLLQFAPSPALLRKAPSPTRGEGKKPETCIL